MFTTANSNTTGVSLVRNETRILMPAVPGSITLFINSLELVLGIVKFQTK